MPTHFSKHHLVPATFTHDFKTAVSARDSQETGARALFVTSHLLSTATNPIKDFVKIHFDSFGAVLVVML